MRKTSAETECLIYASTISEEALEAHAGLLTGQVDSLNTLTLLREVQALCIPEGDSHELLSSSCGLQAAGITIGPLHCALVGGSSQLS